MKQVKHIIALIILCTVALPALAQNSPPDQVAQVKRLDWLVGTWEGTGWVSGTNGTRQDMETTIEVQRKLGGTALVIENLLLVGTPGPRGRMIADGSINVLFWDDRSGSFRLRSHRLDGHFTESAASVGERTLQFRQPSDLRHEVRFAVKLDERGRSIWRGEQSMDGKEWKQFLEFILQPLGKPRG